MSIKTGTADIAGMYVGANAVKAVYQGDELLWSAEPTESRLGVRATSDHPTLELYFDQSEPYGVTVDWGDDSATESSASLSVHLTHTYTQRPKYYNVKMTEKPGVTWQATTGHGLVNNVQAEDSMLEDVRLSRAAKNIARGTFRDCVKLEIAHLEEAETIGASAFNGCTALLGYYASDKLRTIGTLAFYNCSHLDITNPPGLTSKSLQLIDSYAFAHCEWLDEFEIGAGTVMPSAFSESSEFRVWLREGVTVVGEMAFERSSDGYSGGLTLYCEADEKPDGWHNNFELIRYDGSTPVRATVVWGQKTRPW